MTTLPAALSGSVIVHAAHLPTDTFGSRISVKLYDALAPTRRSGVTRPSRSNSAPRPAVFFALISLVTLLLPPTTVNCWFLMS